MCYRHTGRVAYIKCQRCDRPICPDCMRDAAVGFQCPDCVKQGSRETRSGRARYGGMRSADPGITSSVLIGLNAVVWMLVLATGGDRSEWMVRLALLGRGICVPEGDAGLYYRGADTSAVCSITPDGMWLPGVADGAWWQLVTSSFTHVEIWHFGFNMLALWVLGPQLEAVLGRVRFLVVYLGSGLAGSVAVYWLSDPNGITLGASGSIFGLMGALLVSAIKARADYTMLLGWIGLNVLITVMGREFISWQGHLGGFLGGAAAMALIAWAPRNRRTLWQYVGLALLVVALAVAVAARTVVLT